MFAELTKMNAMNETICNEESKVPVIRTREPGMNWMIYEIDELSSRLIAIGSRESF